MLVGDHRNRHGGACIRSPGEGFLNIIFKDLRPRVSGDKIPVNICSWCAVNMGPVTIQDVCGDFFIRPVTVQAGIKLFPVQAQGVDHIRQVLITVSGGSTAEKIIVRFPEFALF